MHSLGVCSAAVGVSAAEDDVRPGPQAMRATTPAAAGTRMKDDGICTFLGEDFTASSHRICRWFIPAGAAALTTAKIPGQTAATDGQFRLLEHDPESWMPVFD